MTIESFSLVEHFDYMEKCIPQPFFIASDTVKEFTKDSNDDYIIYTTKYKYTLTRPSLKKLVNALGVKVKLLDAVCDETDVIDLAMPIINKLFKCFADCFVFYADNDDALTIIDLNVNNEKGAEGTKYENGPSPWKIDTKCTSRFTCFSRFKDVLSITNDDKDILVKADDILNGNNVVFSLFKDCSELALQPMLVFSSKFSNINGFSEIHPALYDRVNDIQIIFPMNYANSNNTFESFKNLWDHVMHIANSTDLNDYIFREVSELASSQDTPSIIKSFISYILTESSLNINQSIKDILNEVNTLVAEMKPAKSRKFKKQLGLLIAWCLVAKHSGCEHCGRVTVH